MRSLKTGEAAYVLGRKTLGIADGETIEVLLDTGVTRFHGTTWDSNYPAIAIFDGLFVAENFHSGEAVEIDHKRNLYRVIIGDDGVRLAELDTELAGQSRAKTTEISAIVRAIQPHLASGMTLETFVTLPVIKDIGDQIIAQETTLLALRQAASINARPVLSEFTLPDLPEGFIELLGRTIDDIAQHAERRVGEHLAASRIVAVSSRFARIVRRSPQIDPFHDGIDCVAYVRCGTLQFDRLSLSPRARMQPSIRRDCPPQDVEWIVREEEIEQP